MTVKDRLKQFIKHKKISTSEFTRTIGVSTAFVSSMRKSLQPDKAESIALNYPELNIEWLLTGEGEMLKESVNPKIIELKPRPMANVIMVPLVSQYAYAGYLAGYADAEYIGTLPTVPMIADHDPKGVYYAFEIKGDSMNDGTSKSLEEGDIIFGRQIQQNLWRYKLHIKKWNFVIVHKTEGILVKRILDHNPETGDIICHSLNPSPEYEDFTVNLNEVAQLFNVVQISRGMRE